MPLHLEGGSGLGLGSVRLEDLRGSELFQWMDGWGGHLLDDLILLQLNQLPGGPGVGTGGSSSFGGPNPIGLGGLGAPKAQGLGGGFGGLSGGMGRPVSNTLHAPIAVNSFGTAPSLSGSSFGQKGSDLNSGGSTSQPKEHQSDTCRWHFVNGHGFFLYTHRVTHRFEKSEVTSQNHLAWQTWKKWAG